MCFIFQIEINTTKIFIEVTSSTSLFICKKVLDVLLKDMSLLLEQNLEISQVKTTDDELNLKNVYPSKNDLKFEKTIPIEIIRDM